MKILSNLLGRHIHFNNLSHIPGSLIDDIYTEPVTSVPHKIARNIKTKVIFFTLFPLLAFINIISNILTATFYRGRIIASHSQDKQQIYRDKAAHAFEAAIKNIFGLAFCFIALYYTREFSFLLIAAPLRKKEILSGGSVAAKETDIKPPRTIAEVVKFIKDAAKRHNDGEKRSIAIKGAGLSQGRQFIPADKNSIVLDLKHLNSVVVSDDRKTIKVGAGATWQYIESIIAPLGLALKVRQASNVFSVGGSLSSNVHGWSHKDGSLVNTVESIKIVNSAGELQELTPADELFGYVIGGLGMFGPIVECTLQVTQNIKLKETGEVVALDQYVNYYHDGKPSSEKTKLHLFRLSLDPKALLKTGVAVNYITTEAEPKAYPIALPKEGRHGKRSERIMTNIARRLPVTRRLYWNGEVKRILADKPPITLVEHMQAPIRAMFNPARSEAEWLQEYFIPGENLPKFLNELGDLLMANSVCLLNASVRPVIKDNKTHMGYANASEMFAVVLCFNQKLDDDAKLVTRRWIKEATALAIHHRGTYYLAYQPFATKDQFRASYPNWQKVLAKKFEVDPNGLFASDFYTKYFLDEGFNPLKQVFNHEGLMKKFGKFLTNVLVEVDPDDINKLMVDILDYADTSEEIFTELHRRIDEARQSFIESKRRELRSLTMIKKDLTQQAFELMYPNGYQPSQPITGILEVGYPGRFLKTMIEQLKIGGKIEVMQEAPAITDVIQSGYPIPQSKTHNLSYAEPDFSDMENERFDLVTCFVGLHHFTQRGLEDFLFGINRVIRKDGSFLLVDHDVTDPESRAMATLAHSVFNAVKGASIDEEFSEIRNFKSLDAWTEILNKYGFERMASPRTMIREGDPSVNTMIRFKKVRTLSHDSFDNLVNIAASEEVIDRVGARSPSMVFRAMPDSSVTQRKESQELGAKSESNQNAQKYGLTMNYSG